MIDYAVVISEVIKEGELVVYFFVVDRFEHMIFGPFPYTLSLAVNIAHLCSQR